MPTTPILPPSLFNPTLYRSILRIWFHDLPYPASAPTPSTLSRWFGLNSESRAAFDRECSSTAKDALLSIAPDRFSLPSVKQPPESPKIAEPFLPQLAPSDDLAPEQTALALILLFDQFARNIFRDRQKDIYTHYDLISRSLLAEFLARGLDNHERWQDSPPWRVWFYLPLMHSEALQDHELLAEKLSEMRRRAEEKGDQEAVGYVDTVIGFEKRHKVIVERFGRYPHRNGMLGRGSTQEEKEYLEKGGETFGT